jgi:UPF0271 protein
VIHDPDTVVARAVMMARERMVVAMDGSRINLELETICVHGDTPGAAALATRIRQTLTESGIRVEAAART